MIITHGTKGRMDNVAYRLKKVFFEVNYFYRSIIKIL